MTPTERLKEIEDHHSDFVDDYYALEDLPWLISRVKKLTVALEMIGHRNEPEGMENEREIFGYLKCCEDVIHEANKVLNENA